MAAKYWSCPGCAERWPRVKQRCSCGRKRPKKRVPVHARTLRDDSYALYVAVAGAVHGVTDESCCVCGKPRGQERRHDRDHDHVTGKPRGLACAGNSGCNALMPRQLTLSRARLIVAYLERVERFSTVSGAPAGLQEAVPPEGCTDCAPRIEQAIADAERVEAVKAHRERER